MDLRASIYDVAPGITRKKRLRRLALVAVWIFIASGILAALVPEVVQGAAYGEFESVIQTLASFGDRSTGTPGNLAAAAYIKKRLAGYGHEEIGSQLYAVPVMRHSRSTLFVPDRQQTLPIWPLRGNVISPETIPAPGFLGPLVYVGRGDMPDFNGKDISGALVLMELDSGKNWLNAASLGAAALIYVDRESTGNAFFKEKVELTPIRFPRFWMPVALLRDSFGAFEQAPAGLITPQIRLTSDVTWQLATGENIYCLIPGVDPKLKEELVLVEAFYDSTAFVFGRSPGADEACGIATLLELAHILKRTPPARSILLVATSGHDQTLAGMRELIWSVRSKPQILKDAMRQLNATIDKARNTIEALKAFGKGSDDQETESLLVESVTEEIKTEVDRISRRLMQLRLQQQDDASQAIIKQLAQERLLFRRLSWQTSFKNPAPEEGRLLDQLVPLAVQTQEGILKDAIGQLKQLKSALAIRSIVKSHDLAATLSLHLSSHGDGIGAFNQGWLYSLKSTINRVAAYGTLDEVLRSGAQLVARELDHPSLYRDTLRPSSRRSWQSYFADRPALGGEVSALAGFLGFSLVTVNDARPLWGTPHDVPGEIDFANAARQSAFTCALVNYLSRAPQLQSGIMPRDGFATVSGRAKFLRHGELFADQPAPGSMILAYQGPAQYYAMVDALGNFQFKGVADKKNVLDKVIIEGYRFDPDSGEVIWAIDKKQTGKDAYRIKMQRRTMETDLVMFACKGTTLFNLLEPRNFRYLTKPQLIDGRREALPMRYWYSRIDTRSSVLLSVYLESGTPLKLTLSDTVLQKKMILTHASPEHAQGIGYMVDKWPFIYHTEFRVARDMWALLDPRIVNLETHGIVDTRIRSLQKEGMAALKQAEEALEARRYDRFAEAGARSWALASRVYDHVEKTQKDVLFGVLFYIALFVPFAFCMERLVFCYTNIHKRIIAFCAILLLLICVIYNVHPAFQLAYSPTVVILAFFIMGLSLMVTLIVFFRFEEEMKQLQRRAHHMRPVEISPWKAFVSAFFLGVSNLRRRRLRTALTCVTLIILTFTIMSFTAVKSTRHHARLKYQDRAPYQGFLLKNVNWQDLPPEALTTLMNTFGNGGIVAPRVWLEEDDRSRASHIPVRMQNRVYEAQGLVGLSPREARVTGIDRILVGGRWFRDNEEHAVLLPERMARNLGIDPARPQGAVVTLWGMPFDVVGIFSGQGLQEYPDLDGEILTPVTFPRESAMDMTEVEMEALESGEDVRSFQSRYQHNDADLTLIIPYRTLLAAGGHLKAVAVRPAPELNISNTAQNMVDRFGLTLFSGEPTGIFLYHASDTLSYSGVPNVLIPMVISVLIVLNTMISSVYERKREIAIYTSVGLAPSHVSFLFIAEAMAFGVLSVVLGYLMAQTTARLFAGTVLWAGITVNYSSLAGVAAMLLVMLVVLISVIYPSRVAAEIAIPDVNRSWTLPEAEGNMLQITLPFLMKYKEHRSIGGFLFEYFNGHTDISHGLFSTGDIRFEYLRPTTAHIPIIQDAEAGPAVDAAACGKEACLLLHTKVWLAPFDFGIMQQVHLQFDHAEGEPGFLEIKVQLVRESGEANAWRRINKAFLHDLRKQLLIWRSLDDISHASYEKLLTEAMDVP